jgi:hypothetical protein
MERLEKETIILVTIRLRPETCIVVILPTYLPTIYMLTFVYSLPFSASKGSIFN